MSVKAVSSVILFACLSCTGSSQYNVSETNMPSQKEAVIYTEVHSIPLPAGFTRIKAEKNSFTTWLRNISLKKDNTVYLYNGRVKPNQSAQFAVLDISVGNKDLQQCADAVMRLRAEYLFSCREYSAIRFTDNEGGQYNFAAPYTRQHLDAFLQRVFGMCGSASLSKQLKTQPIMKMQPGDVLIKGGFPGHAVIVMDMAENNEGEKIYLLAQSYMPAQDIHILINESSQSLSPWYKLSQEKDIHTPEYYFTSAQLKTW